jgi:hypothetical protein
VHVHHLRRKLGDGVIRTLRGVGYFVPRGPRAMSGGRSLTRHLLAWALGALALVWLSFIVAGYQTGRHEADELTDGHLASVATLLLAERRRPVRPGTARRGPGQPPGRSRTTTTSSP